MTTITNNKLTDEQVRTRIEALKNSAGSSLCSTFAIDAMLFEELLELRKQNELQLQERSKAEPKAPTQPVIPEYRLPVVDDRLQESAYKAGLTAGWNFGIEHNSAGFSKCLLAHEYRDCVKAQQKEPDLYLCPVTRMGETLYSPCGKDYPRGRGYYATPA